MCWQGLVLLSKYRVSRWKVCNIKKLYLIKNWLYTLLVCVIEMEKLKFFFTHINKTKSHNEFQSGHPGRPDRCPDDNWPHSTTFNVTEATASIMRVLQCWKLMIWICETMFLTCTCVLVSTSHWRAQSECSHGRRSLCACCGLLN